MKPFASIKVIDLTHVLAGPFCTYQLAMLGAEVIKIESPSEPDMMRSAGPDYDLGEQHIGLHFMAQNANKKSLAIDIKHPAGRSVLEQLISQSDVLVENFRSNVMQDMGLGYGQLQVLNPALVYCSISGFGHTGPKAKHPAYDNVIQAFSGLMTSTGSAETGPVKVGPPVLDYGTGAQAALAISAALFQREKSGAGQHIDVAMLDAALMLMSSGVTETLYNGECPGLPGNSSTANAGYGVYQAKDGLVMIGAYTPKQLANLWSVLEQPDLAQQTADASYRAISQSAGEHRELLSDLLSQRNAQDWEDLLNENGVPAARVRTLDEALDTEQVRSRQVLQRVSHPLQPEQSLDVPVAAFGYDHDGPAARIGPPVLSRDAHEILHSLGMTESEIDQLAESGVILDPVRRNAT